MRTSRLRLWCLTKRYHKSYFSVGRLAEATRLTDWRVSPTALKTSTDRLTRSYNLKLMMSIGIIVDRLQPLHDLLEPADKILARYRKSVALADRTTLYSF